MRPIDKSLLSQKFYPLSPSLQAPIFSYYSDAIRHHSCLEKHLRGGVGGEVENPQFDDPSSLRLGGIVRPRHRRTCVLWKWMTRKRLPGSPESFIFILRDGVGGDLKGGRFTFRTALHPSLLSTVYFATKSV
ncbi:hypothetical protein CDAR_93241 [Caerostris darwini]|uniref:Uncharacterized protein n=1 Tax=Caerostris darwini TaxID=1538125 RepID=A0AAV4UW23_9ARAC|nr:hypothetical protein CDAR_93241 [Caerostris darwini]